MFKIVRKEYKAIFNRATQTRYSIKEKRLDEILETIRTYVYE